MYYLHSASRKGLQSLRGACMLILPQLPNLQCLTIYGYGQGFMTPERHLHVLELLLQLKNLNLHLESDGTWHEDTLEPLTHIRVLTALELAIAGMTEPLCISPKLSQLTQLQELCLECVDSLYDRQSQEHLMNTISKLTLLQYLQLESMLETMPPQMGSLAQLTQLNLLNCRHSAMKLSMPPSCSPRTNLQSLLLQNLASASDKAWQHVCSWLVLLPQMTEFAIFAADLSRVQPSSWSLPSGLTRFTLEECRMSIIPAAVCCLPRLQHLLMSDDEECDEAQLMGLPVGPYLRNLQTLDIDGPQLGVLPGPLALVLNLQTLTIDSEVEANPAWMPSVLESLVPQGCKIFYQNQRYVTCSVKP